MQVKEIMTRGVEFVPPQMTLRDAASRMRTLDVGALPVCDGEKIRGVITDRDIAVRAVADGKDPSSTKVSDVMSKGVVWCYDDDDVTTMSEKMERKQVRRMIVVNRGKSLVGICSLGDVALSEPMSKELAGEILREVSRST